MEVYVPRFFKSPESSYFLFGPRGTGKSTFLMHQYQDALWIDWLKLDVFRTYLARPERALISHPPAGPETTACPVKDS